MDRRVTNAIPLLVALACPLLGARAAFADSVSQGASAPAEPQLQLGLRVGSALPRADLQPGFMAGLHASMRMGPEGLHLVAGLDWARLQQQDSTLVAPTDFPRARVDLVQTSDLYTAFVGATYDIAKLGTSHLYAGATLGATANRTEFETVNMSVPENDVAVMAGLVLGATGPAGPVAWRVEMGWRELYSDLGDAGDFGESTMSSLLLSAGVGWAK